MTISIQRQPRFNKALAFFGVIVVLIGATVSLVQVLGDDASGGRVPAATSRRVPGGNQQSPATQDGYLTPPSILAQQARAAALFELQAGYLPPDGAHVASTEPFLAVQDGYLPPEGWAAEPRGSSEGVEIQGGVGPR